MVYHAYGHGWTGAAIGLTDSQTNDEDYRVPEEKRRFLAMLNGERKTADRGPVFTELCYGNPEVRKRMVDAVVDYAENHPEVDVLHIWLSDRMNNHCECELCRDTRPADFYVMMLNAMDREMTRRRIDTRLAFLVYQDLLWPPVRTRFDNPERFVMMFAPSTRDYRQPYDTGDAPLQISDFVRNKNVRPADIRGNVAFLKAWKNVFKGESFVFDYHMVWFHLFDQGYFKVAEVMAEDIRRLHSLGLGGFVSCQDIRAYWPTGYPLAMHAQLLWNPKQDIGDLARNHFRSTFGEDGLLCMEYLQKLSVLFDSTATYQARTTLNWRDDQAAEKLSRVPELIESFRPVVEKNLETAKGSQALSWEYIFIHMEFAELFSRALQAQAAGKAGLASRYGSQTTDYLMVNEKRIQPVFDLFWFLRTVERAIPLTSGN
jgi:hypothetical protein